jgi:hypothetical protein
MSFGYSEADAAVKFGVSEQTIDNYLTLLDLHPIVQAAVDKQLLSASAASKLSELPKAEQPGALDELMDEGVKLTAAVVERKAKGAKAPSLKISGRILKKAFKTKPEYLTDEAMAVIALVTGAYSGENDPYGAGQLREILEGDFGKKLADELDSIPVDEEAAE